MVLWWGCDLESKKELKKWKTRSVVDKSWRKIFIFIFLKGLIFESPKVNNQVSSRKLKSGIEKALYQKRVTNHNLKGYRDL